MRWLLLALLLAFQVTQEPPRHDQYASDPDAYCLPGQPTDAHGHECQCALECEMDADGHGQQKEQAQCAMFCTRARCKCHPDDPCKPAPEIQGAPRI